MDGIAVVVPVVHLVLIRDDVHRVQEVHAHQHPHVVHAVGQDHEVIIKNLRNVHITTTNSNQIVMEKDVEVEQRVVVVVVEITHAILGHNQMKIYVAHHQIKMVINIMLHLVL